MAAHEHAIAHRRPRQWKDELVVAIIAAAMASALVYAFGRNLLAALTTGIGAGVLAYGAASLQIYRKRHEIYRRHRKSHDLRI
jgi:hypothetical protein